MSLSGFNIDTGTGATLPYRREQTSPELRALASIAAILVDQRTLLERLLTTERTGAVSSVSFEDMAKGDPKVCSKFYVGSPITTEDVDAVLAVHAYAHRRAAELAMNGWKDTVDMLASQRENV